MGAPFFPVTSLPASGGSIVETRAPRQYLFRIMTETELKLTLTPETAAKLCLRLNQLVWPRPTETIPLHAIYYDSEDLRLKAAGIALRVRLEGDRYVQAVKIGRSSSGGVQRVEEIEIPVKDARPRLKAIPDKAARRAVKEALGAAPLTPVWETEMERLAVKLHGPDGTLVEVAVDQGQIIARGSVRPFYEAELELKKGSMAALFDLARVLFPDGGLDFSRLSKAGRAALLAETGRIDPEAAPRRAAVVGLTRGMGAEAAARDTLRECFDQITANAELIRETAQPDGPHQLRIGLRRLRSALSVFGPVIGGDEHDRLAAEARWLGQMAGIQRDLDVCLADILQPAAREFPDEPGFARLIEAMSARARRNRIILRDILECTRTQKFLLDLGKFTEGRGWREDGAQKELRKRRIETLAAEALDKRWSRTRQAAENIATLDVEARHALRKELKKLRYTVEFFAPLHDEAALRGFLKPLKKLQTLFGALNDLAMAEAMLGGADAPLAGEAAPARAVSRLLAARRAQAEADWARAQGLWADLAAAPAFWR